MTGHNLRHHHTWCSALVLTRLGERQVEAGMVEKGKATLVHAVAALDEMLAENGSKLSEVTTEAAAIHYAQIVFILAKVLWVH